MKFEVKFSLDLSQERLKKSLRNDKDPLAVMYYQV